MKTLILIMAFMLMSFSLMAQELPEPTDPPFEYKAEIAWGTSTSLVWQPIPITYQILDGTPNGTHNYWTIGLGNKVFEAVALESTSEAPKFVRITANVASLPPTGNKWWGNFFRIRIYAEINVNGEVLETPKSEPSFWVAIVNLLAPSRPIGG